MNLSALPRPTRLNRNIPMVMVYILLRDDVIDFLHIIIIIIINIITLYLY